MLELTKHSPDSVSLLNNEHVFLSQEVLTTLQDPGTEIKEDEELEVGRGESPDFQFCFEVLSEGFC